MNFDHHLPDATPEERDFLVGYNQHRTHTIGQSFTLNKQMPL